MTVKTLVCTLLLLVANLLPAIAHATGSDVGKETRWAEQVIDGLLDGDESWLDDGAGHEFLGVITEGDSESGRAVVLVHGIGVHPNWPDVIYPLRAGLLEAGITTLSIQMPVLANEAESEEYLPLFPEVPGRIEAALDYLVESGYSRITLVAHSMGASMSVYYLSKAPSTRFDSVVLIGMGPGIEGVENIERMATVKMPLFDLYGSKDLEGVLAASEQRARAGSKASSDFLQQRVEGANHFFQGHEVELVGQVLEWIERQSAQ